MKAAIIAVGNELLIGQVQDTNSAWIAERLRRSGIELTDIFVIADRQDALHERLSALEGRTDLVILTGGLGPTSDDVTLTALAAYFGTELMYDDGVAADVAAFLKRHGRSDIFAVNRAQARVMRGGTVLRNPLGTAPGSWMERSGTVFVSLPGVPFEMRTIMEQSVMPAVEAKFQRPAIYQRTVLTHGIPESELAARIAPWEAALSEGIELAYLPSPGRVRLRLTATAAERDDAAASVASAAAALAALLGDAVYGYDSDTLEGVVGAMLKNRGATAATAESCTGGAVGARMTSVPGASAYFKGGIIAYANEVKTALLGVPEAVLAAHGAVSRETVEAMAKGVQKRMGVDFSVAISGIAGPDGGTPEKPVGTVWIAGASRSRVVAELHRFGDRRETIVERAVMSALNMFRKLLIE